MKQPKFLPILLSITLALSSYVPTYAAEPSDATMTEADSTSSESDTTSDSTASDVDKTDESSSDNESSTENEKSTENNASDSTLPSDEAAPEEDSEEKSEESLEEDADEMFVIENDIEIIEQDVDVAETRVLSSPGSDDDPYEVIEHRADGTTYIKCRTWDGGTYEGDANERLSYNVTDGLDNLNLIEAYRVRQQAQHIVDTYITDDMSDLEKYWTLYFKTGLFEETASYPEAYSTLLPDGVAYYAHSAIGPLGLNSSTPLVCQGYCNTYTELCHAAGLPCYAITAVNHGWAYIPNINGRDYVVDNNGFMWSPYDDGSDNKPYSQFYSTIDLSDESLDVGGDATTFNEWYSSVLENNPSYEDLGSATSGIHFAKIPESKKAAIDAEFDFIHDEAKLQMLTSDDQIKLEGDYIIMNINDSYTLDKISSPTAANTIFKGREAYYQEWGLWDEDYTVSAVSSDHDCITEGCISFDASTGEIKVLKALDEEHHKLGIVHPEFLSNPDLYDENMHYYDISLKIEVGRTSFIDDLDIHVGTLTTHIYVPADSSPSGPDNPDDPDAPEEPDNTPHFIDDSYSLYAGETIAASDVVEGILDKTVTFKSSNEEIATIDSTGKITGISGGATTVAIYINNMKAESVVVKVYEPYIDGDAVLSIDRSTQLYTVGSEEEGYDMKFKSSDTSVLQITSQSYYGAYVKPVSIGTAILTAVDRRGHELSLTVNVVGKPGFNVKSLMANVGDEIKTSDVFYSSYETTYKSSNTGIVKIDGEKIVPVKAGSITLTATTQGKNYTLKITVYNPMLSGPADTYLDGKTVTYKVTGGLGNTTWSSSDESIFTVTNKGVVKPVAPGSATLTAVNNNKTMTMDVNVHNVPHLVQSTIKLNLDETLVIDSSVFDGADLDSSLITYTSSNKKIADISGNVLTPVKTGSVNVAIKADTRKFTLKVVIYNPALVAPDVVYLNNKNIQLKITGGDKTTEWSSSDENILSVNAKGQAKGMGNGYVTVTAVNNRRVLTKKIYVCKIPKYVNKSEAINLDQTLVLDENVFDDAGIGGCIFTSSNNKIAYVEDGKVVPVKTGRITLTANVDNKNYKTTVIIYNPTLVAPDVVYLNNRNVSLKITSGSAGTTWESSNPDVLSITNKGVVKGVANGYSTVTAVNNGRTLTKQIYVCVAPKFNSKTVTINNGDVVKLSEAFDDSGIDGTVFTVNNAKVLSLEDNNATGLIRGRAVITALCDKKKYTMTVNVYAPTVLGTDTLLLDNKTATLKVINGLGTTTWESSDPDTVSITKKGVIKGLKKGKAVITAVNNGRTMEWNVGVYNIPKFEAKQYETTVGGNVEVKLTADDDMTGVVYTSSNKKIATIDDNGIVTGIKKGSVTVTATVGGKKYTTKVVVK